MIICSSQLNNPVLPVLLLTQKLVNVVVEVSYSELPQASYTQQGETPHSERVHCSIFKLTILNLRHLSRYLPYDLAVIKINMKIGYAILGRLLTVGTIFWWACTCWVLILFSSSFHNNGVGISLAFCALLVNN